MPLHEYNSVIDALQAYTEALQDEMDLKYQREHDGDYPPGFDAEYDNDSEA